MKKFRCQCGQSVFFESNRCVYCAATLGFNPEDLEVLSLRLNAAGVLVDKRNRSFQRCANGEDYNVCNWLKPADSSHPLCWGCQFNRTVPDLEKPKNIQRWRKLEAGKKRLLYTLLKLQLPLVNGFENPRFGLLFDFVEDQRSNPDQYPETFLQTGYLGGVITINTIEADDAAREAVRVEMNEAYRTVLGHLRHESGHYFWSLLQNDPPTRKDFSEVFGNINMDYGLALDAHYKNGPAADWRRYYISSYASAHPSEDWAETWGHYLHIYDVMETANAYDVVTSPAAGTDLGAQISIWRNLSIALNEMNRSIGHGDAYPFVVNSYVESKLKFVDGIIERLKEIPPVQATH